MVMSAATAIRATGPGLTLALTGLGHQVRDAPATRIPGQCPTDTRPPPIVERALADPVTGGR